MPPETPPQSWHLVPAGAQVTARDNSGMTPLHVVARTAMPETEAMVADALLAGGAGCSGMGRHQPGAPVGRLPMGETGS